MPNIEEKEDEISNLDDFNEWLEEEFGEEEEQEDQEDQEDDKEEDDDSIEDIEDMLIDYEPPEGMHKIYTDMVDTIKDADRSGWERGTGFDIEFEKLNDKIMGIQAGLTFLGAQSNVGKSSFLLKIAKSVTELNNVFGLYFSIDDSSRELLPRIVAEKKGIPINAVRMPMRYKDYEGVLKKRKEGIQELLGDIKDFKIVDQEQGGDIDHIIETIKEHKKYLDEYTDKKLFVAIDNFHDLASEERFQSDKKRFSQFARALKNLTIDLEIPVWCTAELTKGSSKDFRPTREDIREANKINYQANMVLMLYNEVGMKNRNASIYYTTKDEPDVKKPVLEVHLDKNKFSPYKGRLYYHFIPEMARFEEASPQQTERYNNLLYSDD